MEIATMQIIGEDGNPVLINKSDFNKENQQEYGAEPTSSTSYDDMTRDELGDMLNDRDIDFSLTSRKSTLIALLVENDNG